MPRAYEPIALHETVREQSAVVRAAVSHHADLAADQLHDRHLRTVGGARRHHLATPHGADGGDDGAPRAARDEGVHGDDTSGPV